MKTPPPIEFADEDRSRGAYLHVGSCARWATVSSRGAFQFAYSDEFRVDEWIPFDNSLDWRLERWSTNSRTWMRGGERSARLLGLREFVLETRPTGSWQAPHGSYFGGSREPEHPEMITGDWVFPTFGFFDRLPADRFEMRSVLLELRASTPNAFGNYLTPVLSILRGGRAPAPIRSALVEVLISDLSTSHSQRYSPEGELLICLRVEQPGSVHELDFRRDDGQVVETRTKSASGPKARFPAGTVIERQREMVVEVVPGPGDTGGTGT